MWTNLLLIIIGVVNLGFTLIVYLRNPKNRLNSRFALFIINATFWPLSITLFRTAVTHPAALLWAQVIYSTGTIVPILFTVFAYTITKRKLSSVIVILLALVAVGFIYSITGSSLIVKEVAVNTAGNNMTLGPLYPYWMGFYCVLMTIGVLALLDSYRKSRGYERAQLRFVLIAILFPAVGGIPFNFVLPLMGNFNYIHWGPLFLTLMIATITYAVSKQRFFDIRFMISRTLAYVLLLGFLGFLYAYGIASLSSLFFANSHLSTEYLYLSTVLSLLTAITFQPLRHQFENITSRLFYKEAYSEEKLMENCGTIIRSTLSLNRLTKQLLKEITGTLNIRNGAFLLTAAQDEMFIIEQGESLSSRITNNTYHNLLINMNYKILLFDDLEEGPIKMLLRDLRVGAILPLSVKSVQNGLLLLGEKESGETFTNQDIDVLNILLPQISIAIQNAKSFDEISQFNAKLTEEVERQTKDLKSANEYLKHLDQLKDEFVFIATHELKNPVTAMRGYLSMINEGIFGSVPETMQDAVKQLTLSNQQLVDLVNDLLQIARSEAQTFSLITEPVDLKQVIQSVNEAVQPLAHEKGLNLDHQSPLPLLVKADPQRIREVVQNLVSNAIKYSDHGSITITHEVEAGQIITHIADQGRGINDEDQKKLFTRFFRSEAVASEGIPGTGLGLFIVKQLIEKMGGQIWVTSQLNVGSTFSFSLPRIS